MTYNIADLDIDVANRNQILKYLKHIPASKISTNGINPHGVGVYFCDVPTDIISGLCSIDYKKAEEEYGYVKVDLLHNTELDSFKSRKEMLNILNKEPNWDMLYDEKIVKTLPHINSYYNLLLELPRIQSIIELAYFISIIRPGKKHLMDVVKKNDNWCCIKDIIWEKENNGYMYKKSHAISYATMIILSLNKHLT